ncbi:MAG: YitT family protein [Clostridia bacterium]|nr:YitT family protein [Clostridia bacterium]
MLRNIKPSRCAVAALCGAFVAFGLYQVHSLSGVTEGGVLGLNLLLEHWLHLSPAITNLVATVLCYLLGLRLLGREFIIYSAFAVGSFSLSYRIFEQFDRLWPELADYPLLAALLGAVFVGVGTGICIRAGAAICGDDALAMCISHLTKMNVQWAYLITDGIVLGLSATYIPLGRLWYSVVTVVLSGQIIGFIQRIGNKKRKESD